MLYQPEQSSACHRGFRCQAVTELHFFQRTERNGDRLRSWSNLSIETRRTGRYTFWRWGIVSGPRQEHSLADPIAGAGTRMPAPRDVHTRQHPCGILILDFIQADQHTSTAPGTISRDTFMASEHGQHPPQCLAQMQPRSRKQHGSSMPHRRCTCWHAAIQARMRCPPAVQRTSPCSQAQR